MQRQYTTELPFFLQTANQNERQAEIEDLYIELEGRYGPIVAQALMERYAGV